MFVSGCVLAAVAGLTTWKSASRSLSESWRTWTTQLLFFLSIVTEDCTRYVLCLSTTAPDASKSKSQDGAVITKTDMLQGQYQI